jgi:hypothetical protein
MIRKEELAVFGLLMLTSQCLGRDVDCNASDRDDICSITQPLCAGLGALLEQLFVFVATFAPWSPQEFREEFKSFRISSNLTFVVGRQPATLRMLQAKLCSQPNFSNRLPFLVAVQPVGLGF